MSLKEQLIGAIKEEDNEKVSDVLEQMCVEEVNEKDEYGETALYKACRRKNNQAVSLLLSKPGIFFFFFFFHFIFQLLQIG